MQEPTLSDDEVAETLKDMGDQIRFRLRMKEIIPIEMSRYCIEDGRAHFNVPNMFETSISLRGAQKDDGWFFVHVEFLHNVGGDLTDVQGMSDCEHPRGRILRPIQTFLDDQPMHSSNISQKRRTQGLPTIYPFHLTPILFLALSLRHDLNYHPGQSTPHLFGCSTSSVCCFFASQLIKVHSSPHNFRNDVTHISAGDFILSGT